MAVFKSRVLVPRANGNMFTCNALNDSSFGCLVPFVNSWIKKKPYRCASIITY